MIRPGNFILTGFEGSSPSSELESFVRSQRPAGFIFFARNIAATRKEVFRLNQWFVDLYQSLDELPPILAIDHEGGRIHRLGTLATNYPLPGDLSESAMAEVGRIGHQQGRELFALGFNLAFGPVYDISSSNGKATALQARSWSSDPLIATSRAEAVRSGLEQAGLLTCPKHFPGYGCTRLDPHIGLSHVNTNVDQWRHADGFPFESAIHSGIRALMTAHLTFDAIDPKFPASLSPIWSDILREELGFSGVIVPDDLCMGALQEWATSPAALAVRAFEAGADLALIGHPESLEALEGEIQSLASSIASSTRLKKNLDLSHQRLRTLRKCLASSRCSPDSRIFEESELLLKEILHSVQPAFL